jgi:hypothetical protein
MSVNDLARTIIATEDGRLLNAQSRRILEKVQFKHDPRLDGGYGFGWWRPPGYAVPVMIAGGDVPGTSTRILILPDQQFSIVVAVNRKDSEPAMALFRRILRPYLRKPVEAPAANRPNASQDLASAYRYAAYPHTEFLKLGALFGPSLTVAQNATDLTLTRHGNLPIHDGGKWVRRPDGAYVSNGFWGPIVFLELDGARYAFIDTFEAGPLAFEEIPMRHMPQAILFVIAGPFLIILWTMIWRTERMRMEASQRPLRPDPAWRIAWNVSAALIVLFSCLFSFSFYDLTIAQDDRFVFPLPVITQLSLTIPYFGATAYAAGLLLLLKAWSRMHSPHRVAGVVSFAFFGLFWFAVFDFHVYLPPVRPWPY